MKSQLPGIFVECGFTGAVRDFTKRATRKKEGKK